MKLGIVGSEAAKFTSVTEAAARRVINTMIRKFEADLVISGHSPLGGIDWWAIDEAEQLGVDTREYPPLRRGWQYYRARNLAIANASDIVACVTLKELPEDFSGMRFPQGCYHCHTPPEDHVKSGGCWTMHQARDLGKKGVLVVIDPDGGIRAQVNVLRLATRAASGE